MAFTTLYLTYAPDADPTQRSLLDTGSYKLFSVAVMGLTQAVEVARDLVENEGAQSIVLCPGFTHREVGEIVEAVGDNVAISIARPDGPGNRISARIRRQEGF